MITIQSRKKRYFKNKIKYSVMFQEKSTFAKREDIAVTRKQKKKKSIFMIANQHTLEESASTNC